MLEVVDPGPLATIQDPGRLGFGHLGVATSGACDRWSLGAANLLVGGPASAAAVEITLGGFEAVALEDCAIGLAGADLGAEVDGRRLPTLAAHLLRRGQRLSLRGAPSGARGASPSAGGAPPGPSGIRAYLSLAGGIAVRPVLGSAATDVVGGLGGFDGRALRPGDRLAAELPADLTVVGRAWPATLAPPPTWASGPVGILPGPDLGRLPAATFDGLLGTTWSVTADSDRMGLRLDGPSLATAGEVVSQPMVVGAIQLPPDGRPIVLLADHQTVGGYPVVGVAIAADQPRLGQARAGDRLTFEAVTLGEARARRKRQRSELRAAAAALRGDAVWDRLADDAGA